MKKNSHLSIGCRGLGLCFVTFYAEPAKVFDVTFQILDELGRELTNALMNSSGSWQECQLPTPRGSGIYLIRVTAGNDQQTVIIHVTK